MYDILSFLSLPLSFFSFSTILNSRTQRKGQVGANSSIYKANAPSTSNSFDLLKNVDVGDECGVSSSMGNHEEEQAVGHATASKHTSCSWNEDFESNDEVDEVIFPEGNKFGEQFDIRLKGRVRK
ncbi:hypothetical protein Tco_1543804 [Tanacetum coccineum]